MPITYRIKREKDQTIFTFTGRITFQELVDTFTAYGKGKPTRYELLDLTGMAGQRPSSEEVQRLADYLNQHGSNRPANSKTAVVAAEDVDFGISMMISALTDGFVPYEVRVFRSSEEARAWLGHEHGDAEGPV